MMSTSKASVMKGLKVLYILPLVCGTLALNARTVIDYEGSENPSIKQASNQSTAPAFQPVDTKPSFRGGDANEFAKWVMENLNYPAEAKAAGIQGRVTLKFTVTESGKIADVIVLRGVHPALDAEAVRVISSSPDWTPGMSKGTKVPITFTFPVIFKIKGEEKTK